MPRDNRLLGKFDLVGIPSAPRGVPQIEVTFDIDVNGILNVNAKDMGTGKEQQIRIESSSGLSESEIKKMVKEAESNAEQDKQEREKIDVKNQADQAIYQTEKTLGEIGDKIPLDDKTKIQSAVDDLRKKLKGDDIGAIKASMDALMKASHKMAEEMYKNSGASGQAGDHPRRVRVPGRKAVRRFEPTDKGDGPVDADFTVVDDK